jgi:hypothetical protein
MFRTQFSSGHWIYQCPTNGDPNYDLPKVKKATGIPRSFLKPVQGGDAKATLLLPEGGFAIMIPNEEVFLKEIEKMKFEGDSAHIIPESLKCTLCNGLLNDAVLIPCCGYSFCDECMYRKRRYSSLPLSSVEVTLPISIWIPLEIKSDFLFERMLNWSFFESLFRLLL